jgi:hypothetical protein
MAVPRVDRGIWNSDEFYPTAPPPSPEVPIRNIESVLPSQLLDDLTTIRNFSCSPIPSIEISGRKESFAEFSGSFSTSSSSSVVNGECEDENYSMEVCEGSGNHANILPESSTTSCPIPNGFGDCDFVGHIPHSWHPGLDCGGSESPPKHKALSQSYSYNCSGDSEKTRRRSFSKRRHDDKISSFPVEESGGHDSMECEMKEKKSCQESVLQSSFDSPCNQYATQLPKWISGDTNGQGTSQYLQLPNPLPYVAHAQDGDIYETHRRSEPSFGTNMFNSAFSRSL